MFKRFAAIAIIGLPLALPANASDEILGRYIPWTLKRVPQIWVCPGACKEGDKPPPDWKEYAYAITTKYGTVETKYYEGRRHEEGYQYLTFSCTTDKDYAVVAHTGRESRGPERRTTLSIAYNAPGAPDRERQPRTGFVRYPPFEAEGFPGGLARANIPKAVLTDMLQFSAIWIIYVWIGPDAKSGISFHIPGAATRDAITTLMRECQR